MKKKILIVSHALELGGAERSLIGLLETIDYRKVHVDLFLLRHEGELLSSIPSHVNLLPEVPAYTVLARPLKKVIREGHFILALARLFGKIKAINTDKKISRTDDLRDSMIALEYSHKYTYRLMPKIQPEICYDLAISFLTPHYIVANNVCAKRKAAWIHTDYSKVRIDVQSEKSMWNFYDNIISISEDVSEAFISVFPSLKEKIILIENILPYGLVKKQAEEFEVTDEMPKDAIRLLSIGRFCNQKNFDSIPAICYKLIQNGLNIKWYIIGFGPDESLIKRQIDKSKMQGRVILLGKKENPYPYIKNCDLYVQPSRYEGKSVTVREAQMLGKAVVITDYKTSKSQLEDGVDGMIVPLDINACSDAITELLCNKEKLERIRDNCKRRDYSNAGEVKKLYQLIT